MLVGFCGVFRAVLLAISSPVSLTSIATSGTLILEESEETVANDFEELSALGNTLMGKHVGQLGIVRAGGNNCDVICGDRDRSVGSISSLLGRRRVHWLYGRCNRIRSLTVNVHRTLCITRVLVLSLIVVGFGLGHGE